MDGSVRIGMIAGSWAGTFRIRRREIPYRIRVWAGMPSKTVDLRRFIAERDRLAENLGKNNALAHRAAAAEHRVEPHWTGGRGKLRRTGRCGRRGLCDHKRRQGLPCRRRRNCARRRSLRYRPLRKFGRLLLRARRHRRTHRGPCLRNRNARRKWRRPRQRNLVRHPRRRCRRWPQIHRHPLPRLALARKILDLDFSRENVPRQLPRIARNFRHNGLPSQPPTILSRPKISGISPKNIISADAGPGAPRRPGPRPPGWPVPAPAKSCRRRHCLPVPGHCHLPPG